MKKICVLLVVFLIVLSSIQPSMAYIYYTDILGHWGEEYIDWATNEVGLLEGYNDGRFRPENSITRAEFTTVLNRLLHLKNLKSINTDKAFKLNYNDLNKNFWAYDNIYSVGYYLENNARKKTDIKLIFPGDNFRPNQPITRYEAGILISLITPPPIEVSNKSYKDLFPNLRFYKEVMELTSNAIVQGYNDNTFKPERNITRAEAATIIKNAYRELEYISTSQLYMRKLDEFDINERKPLFEYGTNTNIQANLDRSFLDAVTTLDYLSFVGHIPYSERHLYDSDPIGSLWNLKNQDYYNVIGVNYYLLYYDKGLVKERKVELIREAFQHYDSLKGTKTIQDMMSIIKLSENIIGPGELALFLERYITSINNNIDKVLATTLLVEQYLKNNDYRKALNVHKDVLHLGIDISLKCNLILNNGYLIYKNTGTKSALEYLDESWKDLKANSRYSAHKDEIDFLFTSMIKQLMIN